MRDCFSIHTGWSCHCAVASVDCHSPSIKTNSFTASFSQMSTGTTTMGDGRLGNVWGRGIEVNSSLKLATQHYISHPAPIQLGGIREWGYIKPPAWWLALATVPKCVSEVGLGVPVLLGQWCICTYIFVYNILTKRIRALKKTLQDRSLVEQYKNEAST